MKRFPPGSLVCLPIGSIICSLDLVTADLLYASSSAFVVSDSGIADVPSVIVAFHGKGFRLGRVWPTVLKEPR